MIQVLRKYDKLNSAKLTCYNSLGTCHPGHTFSKFCVAPTKVLIEIIENVARIHKNRTLQPTIELFSYYLTIMVRIRILVRNSDLSESTENKKKTSSKKILVDEFCGKQEQDFVSKQTFRTNV